MERLVCAWRGIYTLAAIKHLNELINPLCYGGAIVGSVTTAYVLWRIP